MGGALTPHLIITRPEPDGIRFADEVRRVLGTDIPITLAPLMEIEPLPASTDAGGFVFTSTNGVAQAVRIGKSSGRAWCVGDRTAAVATAAGFDATSAKGTAEDLIAMIKADPPDGHIAHVRGEHARGDIGPRLRHAGIDCADVIAYTQAPNPLPQHAIALIEGSDPTIIPLFSPRATALLFDQAVPSPSAHLIAISDAAAAAHKMQIVDRPDGKAMLQAVVAAFRAQLG